MIARVIPEEVARERAIQTQARLRAAQAAALVQVAAAAKKVAAAQPLVARQA